MDKGQEVEYAYINVEEVARKVAEIIWEKDTATCPSESLYDIIASVTGPQRIVSERWTNEYWLIVSQVKLLIMEYVKEGPDATTKDSTPAGPQATDR